LRAYRITLSDPKTNAVVQSWSSSPTGLNVEFDFFSYNSREGTGQSTLTIEGIALQDLLQAPKYYLQNVTINAGFSGQGLPLEKPAQAGTIWQGFVNQSFGNWVGTEMTLDFVMNAGSLRMGHFLLLWKQGSSFQDAMQAMLSIAFPGRQVVFNLGGTYALSHDVMHAVSGFTNMARFVHSITQHIQQPGVDMVIRADGSILVYDNIKPPAPKQIAFNELIGQPTWVDRNTMQFVCPMRADIQVGAVVQMPAGIGAPGTVGTTAASLGGGPLKYQTTFQGSFNVTSVRYVGNFRGTDPNAWVTVFSANANKVN
jgi:hypothetical protein